MKGYATALFSQRGLLLRRPGDAARDGESRGLTAQASVLHQNWPGGTQNAYDRARVEWSEGMREVRASTDAAAPAGALLAQPDKDATAAWV